MFGIAYGQSFYACYILVCHMDRMKEEVLKRMPEWFLELRKIYMEKYGEDLYELLDKLTPEC